MKDIILKITGSQSGDGAQEEHLEFVTEGKLYSDEDSITLEYEETELLGYEGCKTSVRFSENAVEMKRIDMRSGDVAVEMKFEDGKRFRSEYQTPYGQLDMEVFTKKVTSSITKDGVGAMCIDYMVSLSGMEEGENKLSIELIH